MSERGTVKNNRTAAVEGHYSPSISHPQVTPYTVTVGLFSSVRQLRVQIKQWASKCIQHSTVEIRDSDVIRQNGELDGVVVWGSGNVTGTVPKMLVRLFLPSWYYQITKLAMGSWHRGSAHALHFSSACMRSWVQIPQCPFLTINL